MVVPEQMQTGLHRRQDFVDRGLAGVVAAPSCTDTERPRRFVRQAGCRLLASACTRRLLRGRSAAAGRRARSPSRCLFAGAASPLPRISYIVGANVPPRPATREPLNRPQRSVRDVVKAGQGARPRRSVKVFVVSLDPVEGRRERLRSALPASATSPTHSQKETRGCCRMMRRTLAKSP